MDIISQNCAQDCVNTKGEGSKPGSPDSASDIEGDAELGAEEDKGKLCLSHALSSFTPRCHPLDEDVSGT